MDRPVKRWRKKDKVSTMDIDSGDGYKRWKEMREEKLSLCFHSLYLQSLHVFTRQFIVLFSDLFGPFKNAMSLHVMCPIFFLYLDFFVHISIGFYHRANVCI